MNPGYECAICGRQNAIFTDGVDLYCYNCAVMSASSASNPEHSAMILMSTGLWRMNPSVEGQNLTIHATMPYNEKNKND